MFVVSFGTRMTETESALYENVFEYVRQSVLPERLKSNRPTYRQFGGGTWNHVPQWKQLYLYFRAFLSP